MKYILLVVLFVLKLTPIVAQKKSNHLNINTGFSIIYPKLNPPNASFEQPLTVEFQRNFKKNGLAIGLQLEYQYLYIFRDSNVYTLLLDPQCNPSNNLTSGNAYCPYYFSNKNINLNFPISYSFQFISKKKIEFYLKTGIIFRFKFFEHFEDSHPLLNSKGVLLNPGPFETKYNRINFNFINYDLVFGSGLNYKLSKKIKIVGGLQYQHGLEGVFFPKLYGSDRVYIILGTQVKI